MAIIFAALTLLFTVNEGRLPEYVQIPFLLSFFFLYLRYLVVSQGRARSKRSVIWLLGTKRKQETVAGREPVATAQAQDTPRTAPVRAEEAPVVQVSRLS